MNQRRHRTPRWIIGTGSVAVLLATYVFLWGPQTVFFLESRSVGHRTPESYITPEALPPTAPDLSPGTKLSYYGYTCEAPWVGIVQERKASALTAVIFRSGQAILFPDPKSETVSEVLGSNPDTERNISLMLGSSTPVSDEVLESRILYATPAKLSPFMDRKSAATESVFLVIKSVVAESRVGHIYWFREGAKRGFQVGDPDTARHIEIVLFRSDGRAVTFTISRGKGTDGQISQAQIERIRSTLKIDG